MGGGRAASALAAAAAGAFLAVLAGVAAFDVPTMSFDEGYAPLFGGSNVVRSPDGRSVRLKLDRFTGSGFVSNSAYQHGFFSASIKLPDDYTAGVVVAFYLSNMDAFPKNHDELDFEFLGHRWGQEWRVQTNVYGNGSTTRGREERYLLPFDPTLRHHRYSIVWTPTTIIFYIDDVPIREVPREAEMGGDYPSKPMSVYATTWDGSAWATDGGKYKVNYKYEPFESEFSELVLRGCAVGDARASAAVDCAEEEVAAMTAEYAVMTPRKRAAMRRFRERYMTYTVCYDTVRYKSAFPECDNSAAEQETFWHWGESKVVVPRRRTKRRASRAAVAVGAAAADV